MALNAACTQILTDGAVNVTVNEQIPDRAAMGHACTGVIKANETAVNYANWIE
jgi:hypothetical protein